MERKKKNYPEYKNKSKTLTENRVIAGILGS